MAPAQDDLVTTMESISKSFLAVERHLRDADLKGAKAQVAELKQISLRISATSSMDAKRRSRFRKRAETLQSRAVSLEQRVQSQDLVGARIGLERVRLGCIACHLTERTGNAERGQFPAVSNTIWGIATLRSIQGKPVKDAGGLAVFVDDAPRQKGDLPPAYHPSITQKSQRFIPQVLPIVRGTKVAFPNEDRIFHNVFSRSRTHHFDLGVYGRGKTRSPKEPFNRTGLVKIYCNIHANMSANILVLANRHFAVTEEDGLFVITGIPNGRFTLRWWHRRGGSSGTTVKMRGGQVVEQDVYVRETKRAVPHKNKFGKPYKRSRY